LTVDEQVVRAEKGKPFPTRSFRPLQDEGP
jgi:hypothetical protein